ncbi:MAG: flagellar hook-length control protein FliK [Alphaproteobacteria bacterium]|nr:flagellar hook-length control protein FliK [Alphaproteobacteria bacterium]
MTMISSHTPNGGTLLEGVANPNTPSVDGAMAIFDAIMVAVAEWDALGTSDTGDTGHAVIDVEMQAETMANQIMSDDSLKPFLHDTTKTELLPVISNLLGDAESEVLAMPSAQIPIKDKIMSTQVMMPEQPLSNQDVVFSETPHKDVVITTQVMMPEQQLSDQDALFIETPLKDVVMTTKVMIPEQPVFQPLHPFSRGGRGHYESAKNPVQMLASLIREAETKISESVYAETSAFSQPVLTTDISSSLMLNSKEHQLMGPFTLPATKQAQNNPHLQTHSDSTKIYGPFPKNIPVSDNIRTDSTTIVHTPDMANLKTETDAAKSLTEAVILKSEAKTETGMEHKIQMPKRDVHIDELTAMRGAIKTADNSTADEQSMMASSLKSSQMTSTALSSSSPSSVGAHLSNAGVQSTGTEHGGGFSGQQQSGQQGSQQNPQQGQPDISVDSRMGLDQGKDGRLLRLNMADTNWTDRLLRHIEGKTSDTGGETIRVILEPAKLGRLIVQISMTGQTSYVQITSATAEAAALLADAEPKLQQALEQNGMKLGQMQTSTQGFSHQWSNQQGSQHGSKDHNSGSSDDGNNSNMKNVSQGEEESTKLLENAKLGEVNILA